MASMPDILTPFNGNHKSEFETALATWESWLRDLPDEPCEITLGVGPLDTVPRTMSIRKFTDDEREGMLASHRLIVNLLDTFGQVCLSDVASAQPPADIDFTLPEAYLAGAWSLLETLPEIASHMQARYIDAMFTLTGFSHKEFMDKVRGRWSTRDILGYYEAQVMIGEMALLFEAAKKDGDASPFDLAMVGGLLQSLKDSEPLLFAEYEAHYSAKENN